LRIIDFGSLDYVSAGDGLSPLQVIDFVIAVWLDLRGGGNLAYAQPVCQPAASGIMEGCFE
jgi:hypothetical protein